jgi:hypothetical protein
MNISDWFSRLSPKEQTRLEQKLRSDLLTPTAAEIKKADADRRQLAEQRQTIAQKLAHGVKRLLGVPGDMLAAALPLKTQMDDLGAKADAARQEAMTLQLQAQTEEALLRRRIDADLPIEQVAAEGELRQITDRMFATQLPGRAFLRWRQRWCIRRLGALRLALIEVRYIPDPVAQRATILDEARSMKLSSAPREQCDDWKVLIRYNPENPWVRCYVEIPTQAHAEAIAKRIGKSGETKVIASDEEAELMVAQRLPEGMAPAGQMSSEKYLPLVRGAADFFGRTP